MRLACALLLALHAGVGSAGKGGGVKEIRSKNQFDTLLKYHKLSTGLPVVVDYYSDSCGPCRMMEPIYKNMAKEYDGKAVFVKVNVQTTNVGQQIRSMPTFQFWMNGKKMEEFSGGDEGSLRRITADLSRKARAMNMEITAENLFEFYKEHDAGSKTLADCQKLLSRGMPADKLASSLKQKYGSKPKMTVKDRTKKKKKGEKEKFVDGSVRLDMADQEELEEALRKMRVENGEIEEGESGDDEGEEEENPFQEFVPGGFVGRAASVDEEKPEAVAIIGGGPAALSAAVYAARAGLKPVVIAPPVGGQLMGKGVDVENYPGLLDMTGPGIVHLMRKQALQFNTAFDGQVIKSVDLSARPFKLTTNTSNTLIAHSVIVATGADSNWLDVPGEYEFRGKGISSCATCDGFLFRDRPVVVIGGGDTAMEDALVLARTSSSVTVIHRRDKFRASRVLQQRVLTHSKITVRWNSQVKEFTAADTAMDDGSYAVGHVVVTDTQNGDESSIDCDAAFVAIGHSPNTEFLKGELEMDENNYLKVTPGSSHTSVEGVFAAGDVHDHVYRQAITSAGSGAMAALDAERWLSEIGFVIEDDPADSSAVPTDFAGAENETGAGAGGSGSPGGVDVDAAAAAAASASASFDKDL
jgi:thioredoxin reductase (NADPH)